MTDFEGGDEQVTLQIDPERWREFGEAMLAQQVELSPQPDLVAAEGVIERLKFHKDQKNRLLGAPWVEAYLSGQPVTEIASPDSNILRHTSTPDDVLDFIRVELPSAVSAAIEQAAQPNYSIPNLLLRAALDGTFGDATVLAEPAPADEPPAEKTPPPKPKKLTIEESLEYELASPEHATHKGAALSIAELAKVFKMAEEKGWDLFSEAKSHGDLLGTSAPITRGHTGYYYGDSLDALIRKFRSYVAARTPTK